MRRFRLQRERAEMALEVRNFVTCRISSGGRSSSCGIQPALRRPLGFRRQAQHRRASSERALCEGPSFDSERSVRDALTTGQPLVLRTYSQVKPISPNMVDTRTLGHELTVYVFSQLPIEVADQVIQGTLHMYMIHEGRELISSHA